MTTIAPKSTLLVARFPGQCACGNKFMAGAQVAWSKSYDHPIVGCSNCNFGTFPGMSTEALLDHARSVMALANNAMNMRAKSVGRLLTVNELAVNAARSR